MDINYSKKNNIVIHKILLFIFMFLAFLGILVQSYEYSRVISIYGFITYIIIVIYYIKQLVKYQINLGITIFLIGSLFWFWKEILAMVLSPVLFENVADYSPFFTTQIPIDILSTSLLSISIFNFFVYVIWSLLVSYKFSSKLFLIKERSKNNFLTESILLLFAILGWLPFLNQFGGFQESLTRLLLFRSENIEIEPSLINYLPVLSMMAASFSIFRIVTKQSKYRYITLLTIIAGGLIAFLSGTRFKIVFLLLPSILTILVLDGVKFSLKKKITLLSIIFSILIGVTFYQIVNRYGDSSSNIVNYSVSSSVNGGDHFTALTHAIAISDELDNYFYQPMFTLFISDFVPRMFWPNKPKSEFWEFYNDRLALAGNLTPSVLGQYFLNWGVFGVFIAAFNFALWCSVCDYLIPLYKESENFYFLWLAVVIITFLFLSFRVYSFNYFFYLLIAYFFGWFFTKSIRI